MLFGCWIDTVVGKMCTYQKVEDGFTYKSYQKIRMFKQH
jgi:hypothetical protein